MDKVVWNNCELIQIAGELLETPSSRTFAAYRKYFNKLGKVPENNVWYDHEADICFGPEQTFLVDPSEFSFFLEKDQFLYHNMWSVQHINQYFGQFLGGDTIQNDEYIYQNIESLKKYVGKHILVIGAGPTAVEREEEWKSCGYDYLWSCTNFYKSEQLKDVEIDLCSVGGSVDVDDLEFLEYLDNSNTLCGFEGGVSPFKSGEQLTSFKNRYPDRTFYFHLRYFSKLGAAARLICFASFLGASKISFIGFDGNPVGKKHAFEGDGKRHDEVWRNSQAGNIYRRQYALLWEYLLSHFASTVTYNNIGHGHESNLTTDILS
jgi:hypothetical protein